MRYSGYCWSLLYVTNIAFTGWIDLAASGAFDELSYSRPSPPSRSGGRRRPGLPFPGVPTATRHSSICSDVVLVGEAAAARAAASTAARAAPYPPFPPFPPTAPIPTPRPAGAAELLNPWLYLLPGRRDGEDGRDGGKGRHGSPVRPCVFRPPLACVQVQRMFTFLSSSLFPLLCSRRPHPLMSAKYAPAR